MNNKKSNRVEHKGMINLLRICTVFLAGVSFWATAQGMVEYVFQEEWQAYAASLAVQGLLLGLNFYLPVFLKLADGRWKKGILIVLTGIILFCSSWFSYVFIAGKVYRESWDLESRILVEQTYRAELFAGNEYGTTYQRDSEEVLGRQILGLYNRTEAYGGSTVISMGDQIDFQEEREKYTTEGFYFGSDMRTVIDYMERAVSDENNAETQKQAQAAISSFKRKIADRNQSLVNEIGEARTDLDAAEDSLNYAEARENEEEIAQARQLRNECNERWNELRGQKEDCGEALERIGSYEIYLESIGNNYLNQVGEGLRIIQNELFKEEPDIANALTQATNLFETLLRNESLAADKGTDYMSLLNEVNAFIQNLNRYQRVKEINTNFENCILELRDKQIETDWKNEWKKRLINLKSLISALPNYEEGENQKLMRYDRTKSSNNLDNMIRSYISDHNAAQQGIIYLKSPYRDLAVFSLILALFFDLAGFATGVLIQIQEEKGKEMPDDPLEMEKMDHTDSHEENDRQQWTTLPMLNEYVYLTGDYTHIDGKYRYSVFKDGRSAEIVTTNKKILTSGLYIENKDEYMPVAAQSLSFSAMEDGARDGIYMESRLAYDDSMLTIASGVEDEDQDYQFLAHVDEYVPVYYANEATFDIFPAGELKKTDDVYTVVVALNEKGTMVGAIYLV